MARSRIKKKICVVTGSRADYGLLKSVMQEIDKDKALHMQLVVTGMHLSKKYGLTYKNIEKDGFTITNKVNILKGKESEKDVAKSVGYTCMKFSDILSELKPDICLLLGDRFEIFAVAIAAYILKLPIAHIHGGEITAGVIDDGFRHSMTKMASIHFATTEEYKKRIVQLGECPTKIFNFGAPGLDQIYQTSFFTKKEVAQKIQLDLNAPTALVTFHPETLSDEDVLTQVDKVLRPIKKSGIQAVFTAANADTHGEKINNRIKNFCRINKKKYQFIDNMGLQLYFSSMKHLDLMIGNSSSGIIEAPSFALPVVNVGDRQAQRVRGKNVIDIPLKGNHISQAITKALSKSFRTKLRNMKNPYDCFCDGRAGQRIKNKVKSISIKQADLKKGFFDLKFKVA